MRHTATAAIPLIGPSRAWPSILALLLSLGAGCQPRIDTDYAVIRGPSINGVAAFVQLLRDTGHATTARQTLPRRISAGVRTVVIVDDEFTGLRSEACDVLHAWLDEGGPRTALLILRDSDAAIDYLRDILASDELLDDRRERARTLLDDTERELDEATAEARAATPPFFDELEPVDRPTATPTTAIDVVDNAAESPPVAARWPLRRRLQAPSAGQTLWESGADRLLVRQGVDGDDLLVLASAAPLLNGGLVDAGNRRLAEQLAALLPADGQTLLVGSSRVASSPGGACDDDDGDALGTWRLLGIQPLPWLAAQTLVALALFCWCRAPIFGRPRRTSPRHTQDFAHHLDAVAGLLAGSPEAGAAFSRDRLDEWRRLSAAPSANPLRRRPR